MRKRIVSALIALCLTMLLPAGVHAATVTDDLITDAVLVVFSNNEGVYDSVTCNDNGAVSIGKIGWHGARALELIKDISAADPVTALNLLGDQLYQETASASLSAWGSRILSAEEGAAVRQLLCIPDSVLVQDATARKDIANYISHARTYDIRTAEATVYYCDLENQYGPGGAANLVSKVKALTGKTSIDTLEEFHESILQVTSNYHSRRNWTYAFCSNLDWNNISAGSINWSRFSTGTVVPANLDVEPPKITSARVVCLDDETFQVEVGASDNKRVTDCRVQVDTDAKDEWASYAKPSGTRWALSIGVKHFSKSASKFHITVTVSDAAGNGTSTRLELTRSELSDLTGPCDHRFYEQYDSPATCTQGAYRVEKCETCGETRQVESAPALGHRFSPDGKIPICSRCGELVYTGNEVLPGVFRQAVQQILVSYQKQLS